MKYLNKFLNHCPSFPVECLGNFPREVLPDENGGFHFDRKFSWPEHLTERYKNDVNNNN